jgi:uncharacterized protein YukE
MSGVQGVPTSASNAVRAARTNGSLSVDPEALLRASKILELESEDLLSQVANFELDITVPCGPDPVSGPAAAAFRAKTAELLKQARVYAMSLSTAAEALKDQANQYGATDQQAKRALEQAASQRAIYQANATVHHSPQNTAPGPPPGLGGGPR